MSFNQYHEWRELKDFANKFNQYCEAIALSGKDFDQLWNEEILPIMEVSDGFENENALLNEFWGGMKNWFGGNNQTPQQAPANPGFTPDKNPEMHNWLLKNDPHYARNHSRQQKLGQFQQQADQMTNDIKGRFGNAMKGFLKTVNDDAMKQQNPHMFKIAQNFYKKILAAAQPVMDSFKMQAQYGKADHSEFNNKMSQMQNSQRQAMANRLQTPQNRANLASKQTGIPADELMARRNAGNPNPLDQNWNQT